MSHDSRLRELLSPTIEALARRSREAIFGAPRSIATKRATLYAFDGTDGRTPMNSRLSAHQSGSLSPEAVPGTHYRASCEDEAWVVDGLFEGRVAVARGVSESTLPPEPGSQAAQ
jgi:hypothetical protein